MNDQEYENALTDDIAEFEHDPVGYVNYAYDWGHGELADSTGPRDWQNDVLGCIGEHLQNPKVRHQPLMLAIASGHGPGKAMGVTNKIYKAIINPHSKEAIIMAQVNFGSLKEGDFVFGSNGNPTKILQIHPQGIRKIYKISFDDGSSTMCDIEHLWSVRGRQQRRNGFKSFITMTTSEILEKGVMRRNGASLSKQWEIPIQEAIKIEHKDVFDAYTIGCWLGDGSSATGKISSSRDEIWEKMSGTVSPPAYDKKERAGGKFRVATMTGLTSALRKYGMIPIKCDTKFIPEEYKQNSESIRRSVVCGMLDTDGEVTKDGTIGYCSTSKQLVIDLIWMVRSLGGKAMMQPTVKKTGYKKDGIFHSCKDAYRCTINFGGKWNPFTHTEKKERLKSDIQHRYLCRWITSIEYSHDEEAMCISVDAKDHLYLANDFIVTHNSALVGMIIDWGLNTLEDTRVIVTANTDTQLKTKTVPEVAKWFRRSISKDFWNVTATRISSTDKEHESSWKCDFTPWSEHNTEAFAGLHNEKKRIILIYDEASGIADNVWEVSEGALTDENTEIIWLAFGNPTRVSGRFRECFRKFRHRWVHRQIDTRVVEGVNLEQIKKWEEDYGEDSDFFKVRVRGQFPKSGDKQFITTETIDAAVARGRKKFEYNLRQPLVIGIDFARSGDDHNVIKARRGRHVYPSIRFKERNSMKCAAICVDKISQARILWGTDPDGIFADGGSIGGPIIDRMIDLGVENIIEVQFGGAADDKLRWGNKRIEMWARGRDWLEIGYLDDNQQLIDDLGAPEEIQMAKRDQMILESKKDMKARGIPSTDEGDAFCLTFAFPVMKKKPKRAPDPPMAVFDDGVGY